MKKTTQSKKRLKHRAQQISAEHKQILLLTNHHGYNYDKLRALFAILGKDTAPQFVIDVDVFIEHYLTVVQNINAGEVCGLQKLFSLNRLLSYMHTYQRM